ncbi:hypothetical protein MSAN_01886400 [Mycena sanguinolenta]|uniref:Uncharacterized protein n=1 Tax=Mycena sanguinolenta TaxID=230812 RepID=A0A8H6XSA7_9AGAR|nr:hypothetical protein MSAN_01886400 [Mycena sanguinolenta]
MAMAVGIAGMIDRDEKVDAAGTGRRNEADMSGQAAKAAAGARAQDMTALAAKAAAEVLLVAAAAVGVLLEALAARADAGALALAGSGSTGQASFDLFGGVAERLHAELPLLADIAEVLMSKKKHRISCTIDGLGGFLFIVDVVEERGGTPGPKLRCYFACSTVDEVIGFCKRSVTAVSQLRLFQAQNQTLQVPFAGQETRKRRSTNGTTKSKAKGENK